VETNTTFFLELSILQALLVTLRYITTLQYVLYDVEKASCTSRHLPFIGRPDNDKFRILV